MYLSKVLANDFRTLVLEESIKRKKRKEKERKNLPKEYKESEIGSYNYQKSLQRAFNNSKRQIFFNPDMTFFTTLTYKDLQDSPEEVLKDVKQFFKKQRRRGLNPKYIYVLEWQKRGSLHVHMITNQLYTEKNKNNYDYLPDWKHGFSSVLSITGADSNFKPYLYLFKYMKKSQRIGKSFVHSSRNLNNYKQIPDSEFNFKENKLLLEEKTTGFTPTEMNIEFKKSYFEKVC